MIVFTKKIKGLNIKETWFAYNRSFGSIFGINAYMHIGDILPKPIGVKKISYTVENSLLLPEAEIFGRFSSTVRNEIRKVEDEVSCFFHDDVEKFVEFYNDFAALKGIDSTSVKKIREIGEGMVLSFAKVDEHIIAAHSYLVDTDLKIARLYHSATCRLNEGVDKTLVGKANKLLHFYDMKILKERGIETYDFGGYAKDTTDKSLQGINKFKLPFGGEVKACVNFFSFPFWALKKIESILKSS